MSKPYVVGTPNATEDVYLHVKPGRERAFILRYFRFNLPRLTKALLCISLFVTALCAGCVALFSHPPFARGQLVLGVLAAACSLIGIIAVFTRFTAWYWGSLCSILALIIYFTGALHDAPYVWNGASIELAATWNVILLSSSAFLVLQWMLAYGILVAWPNTQGFTD